MASDTRTNPWRWFLRLCSLRSFRKFSPTLDEASGFLNRWLFVTGRRKKKQLFNRNIIELGDAIVKFRKIHTWSHKTRKVVWSREAEELFESAWFGYIQADVDKNRTTLARIDLMIKKLGLILAINEMSDTVTKEMLERVLMMYDILCVTFSSSPTRC